MDISSHTIYYILVVTKKSHSSQSSAPMFRWSSALSIVLNLTSQHMERITNISQDCKALRRKQHCRKVRSPKFAPKRTLSKRKIAEINIIEKKSSIYDDNIVFTLSEIFLFNDKKEGLRLLKYKVENIFKEKKTKN
jgi:hypothetical protein